MEANAIGAPAQPAEGSPFAPCRWVVRGCEALLRRSHGIVEFDNAPDCLLRIALGEVDRALELSDGTRLAPGDVVVELHMWNDHVPPIPPGGPDFRWAIRARQHFTRSLLRLAAHMAAEPALADAKALVMRPAFAGRQVGRSLNRIVGMHGFEWQPTALRNCPGTIHLFFDNLWLWLLAWAFNPRSLRRRPFRQLRQEFWISRGRFLATFGPRASSESRLRMTR